MDEWSNPEHPPVDAIDLGGGVWVSWTGPFQETVDGEVQPLIWHWCTHRFWNEQHGANTEPGWAPAGVKAHILVSRDPLHLEPSLYWPDCCGMHGFVRDGRWIGV
jgi:hypothetical protein